MKIYELENLVIEFANNKSLSENQKKSLASNIKRQYNIIIQKYKSNGKKISFISLKKLITPLIENYDNVKNYNSINEFIQAVSEEMKNSSVPSKKTNRENEVEKIHSVILGYPGTTTKGMSSAAVPELYPLTL